MFLSFFSLFCVCCVYPVMIKVLSYLILSLSRCVNCHSHHSHMGMACAWSYVLTPHCHVTEKLPLKRACCSLLCENYVYLTVRCCRVLAQNRRLVSVVVGDPWLTNTAVICTVCNLQPADLIHVSYRNEVSMSSRVSVSESLWNGNSVAGVSDLWLKVLVFDSTA